MTHLILNEAFSFLLYLPLTIAVFINFAWFVVKLCLLLL